MADPERFGKYLVKESIGEGSMAHVYRAHDPDLDRDVAIKSLKAQLLHDEDNADELLRRFAREARTVAALRHESFVAIYDFSEQPPYIVMELVEGKTLAQLVRAGRQFTPEQAVDIVQQLLAALGFAHSKQVIHRDVKSQNVFLLPDGKIKITDFGIAQIQTSTLTQVGSVMGTAAYMSPEQHKGERVDARSDLWSVGIMLFELLSGKRPFRGGAETVRHRVLAEDPAFEVSEPFRRIPDEFEAVLRKALRKSPSERFQDANEFSEALARAHENYADGTKIQTPPLSAVVADRSGRRRGGLLMLFFLGLPLALSAIVYVLVTAKVDPAKIAQRIAEVKCSAIEHDIQGKDITLRGFTTRAEDVDGLRADLARMIGKGKVRGQVVETDAQHCELLELVGSLRSLPARVGVLKLGSNARDGRVEAGGAVSFDVTAPAYDAHLLLDYFGSSGEVVHLAPDRELGNIRLKAGEKRVVGDAAVDPITFEAACPCGNELVLAIASSSQLALAGRSENEPTHGYLDALRKALATMPHGTQLAVDLIPLMTTAH